MRKITFSQATQEAMAETMAKDPTVFAMGEDLARQGGIFGQFKGLPQQFPGQCQVLFCCSQLFGFHTLCP